MSLALFISIRFFSVIVDESYIHLWFYAACHYLDGWCVWVCCVLLLLSCRWIKFWWTCYYLLTSVNVLTSRRHNVTDESIFMCAIFKIEKQIQIYRNFNAVSTKKQLVQLIHYIFILQFTSFQSVHLKTKVEQRKRELCIVLHKLCR